MDDTQNALAEAVNGEVELDLRSLGSTGLKQYGGMVREELLPQLDGANGTRIYREMSENDPVCSGILYAIDKIIRQCKWRVDAASARSYDREAADFLETCLHDMETPWTEVVSEILTMLVYGYAPHEVVYKLRGGRGAHASFASKYTDGRIGWRALPIRSQDTIQRWEFDDNGQIMGLQQLALPKNELTSIPISKLLLFRTSVAKNNPEGRSILRGAYRPWYFKTRIEVSEAIGAERDLAGLPYAGVPPDILNPHTTDPGKIAVRNAVRDILVNIRNDTQGAVMFPLARDANGNEMFEFKLISSGGARQFDTDKIIKRYDQRIALSMLADFMLLGDGAGATGSFAMHSDKSKLFILAVSAFLDIIAEVMNQTAVPRLFDLNTFPVSDYPRIAHGTIEGADLGLIGTYLTALGQLGMPLFPNPALETHLLEIAGLPTGANEVPLQPDLQVEQPEGADAVVEDDGLAMAPAPGAEGQPEVVAKKGAWSEDEHPRRDDGKFGTGSGGAKTQKGAVGATQSGKAVHAASHPAYAGLNEDNSTGKSMQDQVADAHKDFSPQDHRDAAAAHEAAGNSEHAFVHGMLSVRAGEAKKTRTAERRAEKSSVKSPTEGAGLESHEKGSLAAYQKSAYQDINGGLRETKGKPKGKVAEHVKNMDTAIEKNVLTQDMVTHRGMSVPMHQIVKPGDVFRDYGYSSSSSNQKIAKDFAGKGGVIMHITHKAGQKALDVNKHLPGAGNSVEKEFILPREAKLKVQRIEKKGSQHHIYVERL